MTLPAGSPATTTELGGSERCRDGCPRQLAPLVFLPEVPEANDRGRQAAGIAKEPWDELLAGTVAS